MPAVERLRGRCPGHLAELQGRAVNHSGALEFATYGRREVSRGGNGEAPMTKRERRRVGVAVDMVRIAVKTGCHRYIGKCERCPFSNTCDRNDPRASVRLRDLRLMLGELTRLRQAVTKGAGARG